MVTPRDGSVESTSSLPGLIKLHRSFVLLFRFTGLEGTQISPSAGLEILFARIKPKLPGCKFTDHKNSDSFSLFIIAPICRLLSQPAGRIVVLRFLDDVSGWHC
jgi:hypothetical protein